MAEQPTIPTLYHLTSSQSFPVLVALEEAAALRSKGLEYEIKIYHRNGGAAPEEFKRIFPLGKSPIMIVRPVDSKGEEEVLTESRLLIQYISDTYTNGEWVPTSAEDKKRDIYFQEFVKSTLLMKADFCVIFDAIALMSPFGIKQFFRLVFLPLMNVFGKDLAAIYQYMEDNLSESKPWLSGEKFGLADLNAIFPMDIVVQKNFSWDASKWPKLAKWHKAVWERDAYKKALEKGGTYNLKTWG